MQRQNVSVVAGEKQLPLAECLGNCSFCRRVRKEGRIVRGAGLLLLCTTRGEALDSALTMRSSVATVYS